MNKKINPLIYRLPIDLGTISLTKLLGGKLAPNLVYLVLRKELLNLSEMAPRYTFKKPGIAGVITYIILALYSVLSHIKFTKAKERCNAIHESTEAVSVLVHKI